jgi:type I restriction enzyme S subunit
MKIPESWIIIGIDESLLPFDNGQTLRQGWSPQCERFPAQTDDDWGVLKTTAIQDGEFQPEHNKQLPSKLSPDLTLEVEVGDLLLTCAGPRSRCGVICLVRKTRSRLMISGKMYRFRAESKMVIPSYLEAFLRSHDTKKRIDEMKTGISDSGLNLTLSRFKTLQIPLPPLAEQRRIVAKIEELFSELDQGIETLKQARAQLAVYRQALLKHAFEGKLTANWRTLNANHVETADQFLLRIRAERKLRYLQQLSEWKVSFYQSECGDGPKIGKPKEPGEPPPFSPKVTEKLTSLPQSWGWIRLGESFEIDPQNGIYRPSSDYGSGTEIIRIDDFYDGELVDNKVRKKLNLPRDDIEKYAIQIGDILINRVNSMEYLAKCGLVRRLDVPTVFESNIMRLRISDGIEPAFVSLFLSSVAGLSFLRVNAKNAVNQASVNQTDVSSTPMPLCSPDEQREIVNSIEAALSALAVLQSDIDLNLQKAEALRQSILKKAFAGELVPQDPADEPARELLARIRAEREAGSQMTKKSKPMRKTAKKA